MKGYVAGIDMQDTYDSLVLYRDSINAQIEVLARSPDVCTHKMKEAEGGVVVCKNPKCRKVIDSGGYDYCY